MKVADLMTVCAITTDPYTPLLEARQLMLRKSIRHLLVVDGPKLGALPVLDGDELVGIITETDLLRACVKAA